MGSPSALGGATTARGGLAGLPHDTANRANNPKAKPAIAYRIRPADSLRMELPTGITVPTLPLGRRGDLCRIDAAPTDRV